MQRGCFQLISVCVTIPGAAIQAAARDFREIVVKQQESNKEAHVVNMVVQRTRYLDDKLLEGLATMPTDNNVIGIKRQARGTTLGCR